MAIEGVGEVASAITRLGAKLVQRMRHRHADMLEEMVSAAKARVPVDSGELQNGIIGERPDDDTFVFSASAIHGGENYARDVEFGHNAGGVVIADDDFFAGRAPRSGSGMQVAAEPFFFNSADEVLRRHGHELADITADVGREVGWDIA